MTPLRTVVKLFFSCLLLLVVSSYGEAGEQSKHPFLLVEDPWPPYTFGETGETPESGLIVELLEELFSRVEYPVRMELYPWKRCIYMVENEKADALMLTVKTPEREKFAYFAEPFIENNILFYHKRDRVFSWEDFSDLKGLTIGLVAGAKYSQEFQEAIQRYQLKTETVNSISVNFKKLKAGRIDITPVLDVVAAKIIADDKDFVGQFATASKPLRVTPMQMAIARSSKMMRYSQQINQTILEMKKDGTVESLYRKYVPEVLNTTPLLK